MYSLFWQSIRLRKFEDPIPGKVANINHNLQMFKLDFYFQCSQVFQIDINIKFEHGRLAE